MNEDTVFRIVSKLINIMSTDDKHHLLAMNISELYLSIIIAMKKLLPRFLVWVIGLTVFSCSKDSSPTPPTTLALTISNLLYNPSVITLKHSTTNSIINGTIDFNNAVSGVSKLRLTTSTGADVTTTVPANTETNGTLTGAFQVTLPATAGSFTFQLWIIDGKGNNSNKLSGTIQTIIDDNGISWSLVSQAYAPSKVIWANNRFTAVGVAGSVLSSPDGVNWTPQTIGGSVTFSGITWSGTKYVGVGNNSAIYTSPDGNTWTSRSLGAAGIQLNTVVWSGTKFVSAGEDVSNAKTAIATSPDGINWSVNSNPIAGGHINAIAWSGTQFVAVGKIGGSPLLLTSADGNTWTNKSSSLTGGTELTDIIWTGSRFAAVGFGLTITSSNGVNWNQNTAINFGPSGIAWSGNRFVAAAVGGAYVSTDGLNWTKSFDSPYPFRSIAWSGLEYIAVGFISPVIMVSPS